MEDVGGRGRLVLKVMGSRGWDRWKVYSQNWWMVDGWTPKQMGLRLRPLTHTSSVFSGLQPMLGFSGFPQVSTNISSMCKYSNSDGVFSVLLSCNCSQICRLHRM